MNHSTREIPVTLESIRQQKAETLAELKNQKTVVATTARKIVAPLTPAVHKGNALIRAFNTGMAIFDGALIGIKLMRKIRKVFR